MALVRYNPWDMLGQIQQDLNKVFDAHFGNVRDLDSTRVITGQWAPAVDVKEEDDKFVILADLPGVELKDIEITMADGVLSIKGERNIESKEEKNGYRRVERAHGTFYRRFSLPDSADPDKIEATAKNGVVQVVIPKQEKQQPRRITVNG